MKIPPFTHSAATSSGLQYNFFVIISEDTVLRPRPGILTVIYALRVDVLLDMIC